MKIPLLATTKGYYAGTRRGGSWWRPFLVRGWIARGNSEVWLDEEGLHFRRNLTSTIMTLPFASMVESAVGGMWWGGKWLGVPVLRVRWRHEGSVVESGFAVSRREEEVRSWAAQIASHLGSRHLPVETR
jgi:hypothetical protein